MSFFRKRRSFYGRRRSIFPSVIPFVLVISLCSGIFWMLSVQPYRLMHKGGSGYASANRRDISQEALLKETKTVPGRVWLINYADGPDVFKQNALFQVKTALNRGVEGVMMYGPKDLDAAFQKKNAAILKQKTGAGYWLWKPYIILKTLERVADGDVVLYLDSGMSVTSSLLPLVNQMNSHDLIVFKAGHANKGHLKRDCVALMGMEDPKNPELTEELMKAPMICATLLLVKNGPAVRAFMRRWLAYGQNPRIITDRPSQLTEYKDLFEFRHDQSIFSTLVFKTLREKGVHELQSMAQETLGDLIHKNAADSSSGQDMQVFKKKASEGAPGNGRHQIHPNQQHSDSARQFYPLNIYVYPSNKFDGRRFFFWHRRKDAAVSLYNLAKTP